MKSPIQHIQIVVVKSLWHLKKVLMGRSIFLSLSEGLLPTVSLHMAAHLLI